VSFTGKSYCRAILGVMRPERRTRFGYVAAAIVTMAVGLVVHFTATLPTDLRDIVGDALWATMVAWWMGALFPRATLFVRAALAFATAWTVELSQLYHAPWLERLREITLVQLVIGTDFDGRDLPAYAAGIVLAVFIEAIVRPRVESRMRGRASR
jgi:hypothetical protein